MAVVDDFVADKDRRAIALERQFDDGDGAIDPGAKAARRGDQQFERRVATRDLLWGKGAFIIAPSSALRPAPLGHRLEVLDQRNRNARMNRRTQLIAATMILAALAGCRSKGELVIDEGVGVTAVRSACPAVGIPDYTGDITMFRPGGGATVQDIDIVAAMTNLRTQCDDGLRNGSGKVNSTSTFDVLARRADTRGARQVTIPYFVTVLRGGSAVVSKRIGQVVLNFADGQERAQARGQGSAMIDRAEATLRKKSAPASPASAGRATKMRRSIR